MSYRGLFPPWALLSASLKPSPHFSTFKTTHCIVFCFAKAFLKRLTSPSIPEPTRSSLRPISIRQLHTLLHFHLGPIYLVVFKGSYDFRLGYLILRGASRLDAFSVYPVPAWLPGYALGSTTGTPAASPPRSSRTRGSSSQISYARAG